MSFKGINNRLLVRLVDWGLPPAIIHAFITELERSFSDRECEDVPGSFLLGLNTNVIVNDPGDSNKRYVFFVRFMDNEEDYWISDIQCIGVMADNTIFWEPD